MKQKAHKIGCAYLTELKFAKRRLRYAGELDRRRIVGDKPNMSLVSAEIGKRAAENELR